MKRVDVIVLGAGAAGMFAAIEAARRGRRVLVIDHAKAVGEKIRISGGGRCNFTNLHIAPDRFLSANPRFALSALSRYTQHDFIARVNRAGIAWHEKTLGQLFCDGSAMQIVDMLRADLAAAGGEVWLGTPFSDLTRGDVFRLTTPRGVVEGAAVVVATGGRSIPKMGATGAGYDIARAFGLRLVEPRPGLVPLTFGDAARAQMAELAGLAVPARVGFGKTAFEEGLLFTHRGLSGPSILQISSYWQTGRPIRIDLTPGVEAGAALAGLRQGAGRQEVANALARLLPERLARAVCGWAGVAGRLADLDGAGLRRLAGVLDGWEVLPTGTEGWRTAEVTLGGVDTRDLDARTMQARAVPGLYFVGEVVDVTGWLGGYNFQWAWSSGWAAGQAV
ncbi:NAD(P)/FAD-dependent oxidoreductase [Ruixingdingia sedimenti]|uniref:NAD(P)/FAD-dependent oxidoreductase n=1 Tax=Ruixingdingia sedimenti TaxID=3073604 RepID=A0ABU1FE04_9RHOB|nr:NAD(P)/FAD-dependent oxidoreductase [Xinfangfangia sp. LG-4]MDR5655128.1 NAD(P)/FAD-dependent oxidoreductase [Xinfangfangia sp. LG-4]